jgi:hypothetical protein
MSLSEKVCIFVHYERSGILRRHTRRYLISIAEQGFSIVFVSNSPLQEESLRFLSRSCYRIILRDNCGYDFAAYRDGLLNIFFELNDTLVLLLANDSVYAPISPLSDFFMKMDFSLADVWGATDSWQRQYHIQSYFIAFGPMALAHPGFHAFWLKVRNVRSKWAAVKYYELGLTRAMLALDMRCAAVFDYQSLMRRAEAIVQEVELENSDLKSGLPKNSTEDLSPGGEQSVATRSPINSKLLDRAESGVAGEGAAKIHADVALLKASADRALHGAVLRRPSNPVVDLWLLLMDAGFPFLKRELLRDDPTRSPDLFAWHRIVNKHAPALYAEIIEDLKRVIRRASP